MSSIYRHGQGQQAGTRGLFSLLRRLLGGLSLVPWLATIAWAQTLSAPPDLAGEYISEQEPSMPALSIRKTAQGYALQDVPGARNWLELRPLPPENLQQLSQRLFGRSVKDTSLRCWGVGSGREEALFDVCQASPGQPRADGEAPMQEDVFLWLKPRNRALALQRAPLAQASLHTEIEGDYEERRGSGQIAFSIRNGPGGPHITLYDHRSAPSETTRLLTVPRRKLAEVSQGLFGQTPTQVGLVCFDLKVVYLCYAHPGQTTFDKELLTSGVFLVSDSDGTKYRAQDIYRMPPKVR